MTAVALRAVGFVALILIGGALAMYVFTRDRRWLRWAGRGFAAVVGIALVVAAFLVLERLILAI